MAMRAPALLLVLAATAALADEPVVTAVPSKQMKPGYGVVESITPVRLVPERSAAAGGSASSAREAQPMYRIGVRMPDGSVQFRDLDKPEFRIGDNVLLTNAGDIVPD
jgi:hypothetical protein